MDINEATSRVLSAERSAAHMTIKELVAQSEIPERTLIRVLKGERDINVLQIAKLAPVFGLYPHEIIESAEKLIERSERGKIPDYQEDDTALADFSAEQDYANAASVSARLKGNARPEDVGLTAKRGDAQAEADEFEELP